jgi:hypothetical protein
MRPPFLSIALLSATALAYEILLMRLFSIIQWHNFAYMIISIALLGYGASGTFLTLTRRWAIRHFTGLFIASGLFFSLSSVACFLIGQHIPFNPLEMAWSSDQIGYLFILYILLALPFFAVANCIGLALSRFMSDMSRVYGLNLLGSGAGALSAVILLFVVPPITALIVVGAAGLAAVAVGIIETRLYPLRVAVLLLTVALPVWVGLNYGAAGLHPSPYKRLSQTLSVVGTEVVAERSSPLGTLTVVRSPRVPFRYAPGLSPNTPTEPPSQLAIFTDGDGMNVITADDGQPASLIYMDFLTSAIPYHLLRTPKVLVLGAGGGADVLQAKYMGARHIDAVELNPQIIDLVRDTFDAFSGGLYSGGNVHLHTGDGREYIAKDQGRYHLIQVALLDAFSASTAGLYALSESYLYTVESIIAYMQHLHPDGLLAITRWIKIPPRDGLKLFATAVVAFEAMGVQEAGRRLALIRGWQTSTLLVKNGVFSAVDIRTIRHFCKSRSFDMAYYPGMTVTEANQVNRLPEPYYFDGAQAILHKEKRAEFLSRYKFNLTPPTDNRPYFFHFFKWTALWELLQLRSRGGLPLLEQGYLVLIATLVQAVLSSVLLILAPLFLSGRWKSSAGICADRGWVVVYFFSLGIAFLFIEIAFIQKCILFFRHPLYAAGVVISAFLLFAGAGSSSCARLANQKKIVPISTISLVVCGIAGLTLFYMSLLKDMFESLLWLPEPVKVLLAVVLIAPLAFCMGLPFPLGLRRLADRSPDLIPWAWGINGCASVISAVLATMLATHVGFAAVLASAVGLYALAAIVYPHQGQEP